MKRLLLMAFICLITIGITSCDTEKVSTFDLDSIERVDPQIIINRIDILLDRGDLDKASINLLEDLKEKLLPNNISRAGNSEVICDNSSGWIVIDNDTGNMILYEYNNSPSGISARSCETDCAMDHCFGQNQ